MVIKTFILLHKLAVFFAYNFLQFEKVKLKLKNPEQAINHLREIKLGPLMKRIGSFSQLFGLFA